VAFGIFRRLSQINLAAEPTLRFIWVRLRAIYFIKFRRRLRTLDSAHAVKSNIAHNLKSIFGANNRMHLLLFPLAVIETLRRDARILVVGPRNENDLYTLVGLGFRLENITGLDLISYSPHIELGDMHAIPFADGTFDAVVCGWTLSYSTNPQRAADEFTRVVKPGGVIAIGVEYSTMTPEDETSLIGYNVQEFDRIGRRVNSTADLKALFSERIGTVFFEHDAPNRRTHTAAGLVEDVSNVALVFAVKADPAARAAA
jgi:SAM-dependent methyltransferase